LRTAIVIIIALLLGTCSQKPNQLEQVLESGELRVVTRNSPTTFYLGAEGPAGFEHDLAQLFANQLGVGLVMYAPAGLSEVLNEVRDGRAHFAAAGLSITASRKKSLLFGPPYQEVTQQLVYRYGQRRPRALEEITDSNLMVAAGSVMQVANTNKLNHRMKCASGLLGEESPALLREFFLARRKSG